MRSGSTSETTEIIQELLRSPNCKTALKLEVYVNGAYEPVEDLDIEKGVDWTESGKKRKYANFALTPMAGTIAYQVDNINGKYSPGSGQTEENYFKLGSKIRLSAGYVLQEPLAEETTTLTLNDTGGIVIWSYFFNTAYSGGSIAISDGSGIVQHFTDLFTPLYDNETYDDSTYSPDAYTVQTYDSARAGYEQILSFKVTANSVNGFVYYRLFDNTAELDNSVFSDWTYAGKTISGEQTYDIPDKDNRFIQVAVIYDGITWSATDAISAIKVTTKSYVDYIYKNVYYLDTPMFDDPPAPLAPKVFCTGRDVYKRAIETDVDIQDYSSSNITPTNFIKSICNKIGIKYSTDSIADITGFTNIAWGSGFDTPKSADVVFANILEKIAPDNYQMWIQYDDTEDDSVLYVQPKPDSSTEADGAFDYRKYISIGNISRNGDKVLNRITVITNTETTSAEELLDTVSVTGTGTYNFSWVGNGVYKRFEVDVNNRDKIKGTVTVDPQTATLTVTEVTGTVEVRLYGNQYTVTAPIYEGEAISFNNQIQGIGTTEISVNEIMSSDAECKATAEKLINDFQEPITESTDLVYPYLNLIWEINDLLLMWRRFFLDDNLYFITKISHHWDLSSNPLQETKYDFEDSGNDFEQDFIYDDTPPMKYDTGFLYDMGISTPLSTNAEIDAASIMIYNVPFS